ncbi:hypothetical protein M419DRAFT_134621 [Trichoderma reesei RUT C-30]|uniref:Uncharacterized protein n=1 Tax=Hypocrea jecorina (strain ATCC 56765 / BCRC 32924 / NRRL 11460 / Rut C-30) TaxID=1344414 RepID=A0A024RZ60_HYPJR|nr:hypothetical protein M419DRAFT_134621 [Trichoderma reesei RUT C-30]
MAQQAARGDKKHWASETTGVEKLCQFYTDRYHDIHMQRRPRTDPRERRGKE